VRILFHPLRSKRVQKLIPWCNARGYTLCEFEGPFEEIEAADGQLASCFAWYVDFPDTPQGNEDAVEFKMSFV
jgi:hypothetical protein